MTTTFDTAMSELRAMTERAEKAEANAAAMRELIDYYVAYPDTRCGADRCVTIQQLQDRIAKVCK
jgi:hypothetical protein